MEDGDRRDEPAQLSRQELYEEYVNHYLQPGLEVRPCCDASLLKKAAEYLLRGPEPTETFTVFPFHQAVTHGGTSRSRRSHLEAFSRATELLETICVHLVLQPWRKEIRTLKTFTAPFMYGLLPALSSSTIQSVLGSIGYLPHADTPPSEYRLREDANPDRAMLLGFELLLARVECDHLLEIMEKDQLEPQDFLDILQRRMGPTKLDEPTEKKTTMGQKEEENKKMEEAHRKEVPLLDTGLAVKPPQPKPRRCCIIDQSIIEMQKTYPDLVFRGRRLLPDKPQRANGSSKDVHTDNSGDSKAAEDPKIEHIKGTKVATTTIRSRNDGSKADDVFGDDCRGSGCNDRNSGGPAAGDANSSLIGDADGSRGDGELRGPQALSLHITLRAASKAEPSQKPGEAPSPPTATQQQTVADLQMNRPANPKPPSLSFTEEEEQQELRELAESMSQLHVHETNKEVKRKEEHKREEVNTNEERSQTEEENLGQPVMSSPALSRAAGRGSRGSRASQSDPAAMDKQKQHTLSHHSALASSTADSQSCKGGDGSEQQEAEHTVRAGPGRDEEQLTKSFVIVEHHNK